MKEYTINKIPKATLYILGISKGNFFIKIINNPKIK